MNSKTHTSPKNWPAIFDTYKASGLTQRKFCARENISYGTFKNQYYKNRPVKTPRIKKLLPVTLKPKAFPAVATSYVLRLPSGIELKVPQDFSESSLSSLLGLLGAN